VGRVGARGRAVGRAIEGEGAEAIGRLVSVGLEVKGRLIETSGALEVR
jgi:hypothetical protein